MIRVHLRMSVGLLLLAVVIGGCHKAVPTAPVAAVPVAPPQPPSAPTVTLGADRTTITPGQAVTLTWQSTNATAVTIDNAIGNVAMSGSRQVSPQASTTYTATARGAGGTAASPAVRITVNVPPPVARPSAASRPAQPARSLTLAEQFQQAMQSVLFDYDKSTIRTSEIPKLQADARWLIQNPSVRLTIEGNADERGSQEYNIALGDERAAAVKQYLANQGIMEGRIGTVSYGEERPLCLEQNEDCWQRNRRAQFAMSP